MTLSQVLSQARRTLESMSDVDVDKMVKAQEKWFEGEATFKDFHPKGGTKKQKISYIMGADPIAEEGGLLDFLVAKKVLPRAITK